MEALMEGSIPLVLTERQVTFLKFFVNESEEGIHEKVKQFHDRALTVFQYPCIKRYGFAKPSIPQHPLFKSHFLSNNWKEHKVLDIGCCMGTDLRYLQSIGANTTSLYGIELLEDFLKLGDEFFGKSDINFLVGNVLDQNFLATDSPFSKFINFFDYVYTGSVIHLFSLDEQKVLFTNIRRLLKPGGTFFGRTTGLPEAGVRDTWRSTSIYLHNPDTLKDILNDHFKTDTAVASEAQQITNEFATLKEKVPSLQERISMTFSVVSSDSNL